MFACIIPPRSRQRTQPGDIQPLQKPFLGRYTPQTLWSLFLMCALPQHIWTLLLAFNDISWLTDRTNSWDAIGVLCYGLLFAFVESVLVFIVAAILGLLIPKNWEQNRRLALLGTFAIVLAIWGIVSQTYFLLGWRVPDAWMGFLVQSGHPARYIYSVLVVMVAATFLLPAWAVLRQGRGLKFLNALIDRLGMLMMLYLVFDFAALIVVVIRNL